MPPTVFHRGVDTVVRICAVLVWGGGCTAVEVGLLALAREA
jgi:hypothetical protein